MKNNTIRVSLLLIGVLSFFFLAYLVAFKPEMGFDGAVSHYIQQFRSPELTALMKLITYTANWQAITLLCMLFLLIPGTRASAGYLLAASSLLTTGCNNLLKLLFHRIRPEDVLPLVSQNSFSFPSGHAMSSLVFYGLLIYLLLRRIKNKPASCCLTGLLCVLIFFIGLSRVYLGVHYPTDVLAGWSMGLCLLILFEYAADGFSRKHIRNQ